MKEALPMGDLKAVLSALQGAKGGDREIDCLIYEWLHPEFTPAMRGTYYGEFTGEYFHEEEGVFHAPDYTDPVAGPGLCLALVAEKLPEHTYLIGRGKTRPEEPLHGVFFSPDGSMKAGSEGSDWPVEVEHESLPICILTALFSALFALHEGGPTNG
jgi:hypothetical protein